MLIVAGVCLPVPLLGMTGLSIPLPAAVERIAATLVPWADAATLGADGPALGAPGSIVLALGEGTVSEPSEKPDRSGLGISGSRRADDGDTPASSSRGGGGTDKSTPKDDGGGKTEPPVTPGPGPGDEDPKDEPGLVGETVDTVEETVAPVKDEVDSTLDGLGHAVDDTAGDLLGSLP